MLDTFSYGNLPCKQQDILITAIKPCCYNSMYLQGVKWHKHSSYSQIVAPTYTDYLLSGNFFFFFLLMPFLFHQFKAVSNH